MVGQTIGHYQIVEKLGEGGMGVVYKAEDMRLERLVAIKFLPKHIATNREERQRFEIEAKAAAALNHPNIATIHAIEEVGDELFLVMECVEGKELKQILAEDPRLSMDRILSIAAQIAEGLRAAHAKGIVHRDVKSANIMITGAGQVKIMDFGLAKVHGTMQVTKAGSTLGTIAYMSPEQARGEQVDQRTDIWSFGVVLYEMLAGRLPFAHEYEHAIMYSILNEPPEPITSSRPETPASVLHIVDKALAKDLSQRYESADTLLEDLRSVTARIHSPAAERLPIPFRERIKQPRYWVPGLAAGILIATGIVWWTNHLSDVRWAREQGLPGIERAIQDGSAADGLNAWTAYELAEKTKRYIPDDPLLTRLLPRYARKVSFHSVPVGAHVYAKPYSDPTSEWRSIGETPVDSVSFPLGFSRIRIEMAGYRTVYDVVWNLSWIDPTFLYHPVMSGAPPEDMELIPDTANWYEIQAAPAGLHMPGLENLPEKHVGSFLMDKFEVTNKEYKRFVDSGGYKETKYWKYRIVQNGRELRWDDAMKLFVDRTGQRGPATWEVGDYPTGHDNYPVSGVSWYEAAAYAEFAGKSLPTIYHWDRVAFTWASPVIVPLSNLRGDGPREVGSTQSINRFGVYDLAGNVREWCINKSSRGGNFILGGGWNDPAYAFNDAYAQSPMDRTETNGFRCITYLGKNPNRSSLEEPVVLPFRDFLREPIASDKTFALYLSQYAYDKTPLDVNIDTVKEESDWTTQKISFNAAYGGERMMAYLFLPKNTEQPFQTVVHFPGSGAIHTRSSESLETGLIDFLLKSGRAVMFPIYKSTYERGDGLHSDYPDETNFWKEHVMMWVKDLSRSIDYLDTRKDIDPAKIAYYGVSWGGGMGGIIPAVEKRIKVSVLLVAGLLFQHSLPEVDPIHFLPRIKTPVLMLNGKYDFFFPYETSQRPFFELLGTPEDEKQIIAYEGGHSVPRTQLVKETLLWLDRYFGKVR